MVEWGGNVSLRKEWEGKVMEKRETREKVDACRWGRFQKRKKNFSKEEKRTLVEKDIKF